MAKRNIHRIKGEDFVSFEVAGQVLTIKVSEVHKDLLGRLLVHGLNAKVGDSAASDKTDKDRIRSLEIAIKNLKEGRWSEVSSGGTMLAEAVARVKKIDIIEAQNLIDGLDDEQLKAVQSHPKVKLELSNIKQERAKEAAKSANVEDLDAVLGL